MKSSAISYADMHAREPSQSDRFHTDSTLIAPWQNNAWGCAGGWIQTKGKNSSKMAYHAAVEKIEAEPDFCRGPLQWHLCHDQHSDLIDINDRAFKLSHTRWNTLF